MLSASIFSNSNNEKPRIVLLHGGGRMSGKERTSYLSERLLKRKLSSFAFDYSGHGESTGLLKESSLKKKFNEALQAVKVAGIAKPMTVIGASMSGYLAIKLLNHCQIENLILFCPAIYDRQAFDVKFGADFTEIIRKKEGWRNTDILSTLNHFTGNLLVIIGEKDEVIPADVIRLIDQNSTNVKKKKIVIVPDCTHQIHHWLMENPETADKVSDIITEFIRC